MYHSNKYNVGLSWKNSSIYNGILKLKTDDIKFKTQSDGEEMMLVRNIWLFYPSSEKRDEDYKFFIDLLKDNE